MELGAGEVLIILVIVLLLFGPTKLPQLGEALGRGIKNFKKGLGTEEAKPSGRPERGTAALSEPAPKTTSAPSMPTGAEKTAGPAAPPAERR